MWQFTAVGTANPCPGKSSVLFEGLALAFIFAVLVTYPSESSSYAQFSATLFEICTDKTDLRFCGDLPLSNSGRKEKEFRKIREEAECLREAGAD